MTCALCPFTVTTTIKKIDGVISASADFKNKTAVAIFDDTKTSLAEKAEASKNAGYPATLASEQ